MEMAMLRDYLLFLSVDLHVFDVKSDDSAVTNDDDTSEDDETMDEDGSSDESDQGNDESTDSDEELPDDDESLLANTDDSMVTDDDDLLGDNKHIALTDCWEQDVAVDPEDSALSNDQRVTSSLMTKLRKLIVMI